ncbi:MAG: sodium:proton antiporter [marine bacterium B5-7]|nr:MAG: sodium:proton antiporter [marine bacterium B5-7]
MIELSYIAIILLGIIGYALLSSVIESSIITLPMYFATFGWLIGEGGVGIVPIHIENEVIHVVAEITLVLILFSDASRVNFRQLTQNYTIAVRMLLIGMPLTIIVGSVLAHWVSPEASWALALLVAAILTPTDAALGQTVVSSESVPLPIRQSINVESGLNDGLALPVVLIAALAATRAAGFDVDGVPDSLWFFALGQVTLGPLAGVLIGYLFAQILNVAVTRKMTTEIFQGIYFLATAFLAFVVAEMIGGNGLIAAFVGGLAFGNTLKCSRSFIDEFMESEGQLLTIFTFMIFGAVMIPLGIAHATWQTVVLALLFLTVIRMVPIILSLGGSGLNVYEKCFLGWFGPRGVASILFTLLVLEQFNVPRAEEILACVVLTVILSIVLHGISAKPLSAWIARRAHKLN